MKLAQLCRVSRTSTETASARRIGGGLSRLVRHVSPPLPRTNLAWVRGSNWSEAAGRPGAGAQRRTCRRMRTCGLERPAPRAARGARRAACSPAGARTRRSPAVRAAEPTLRLRGVPGPILFEPLDPCRKIELPAVARRRPVADRQRDRLVGGALDVDLLRLPPAALGSATLGHAARYGNQPCQPVKPGCQAAV